jgi:plasmid stability protein
MATITIRNLDDKVKRKLQVRAALNGRSMEAEVRAFLTEGLENTLEIAGPEEDLGTAIHKRFAAAWWSRIANPLTPQVGTPDSHL